jgi:hypothetical protein
LTFLGDFDDTGDEDGKTELMFLRYQSGKVTHPATLTLQPTSSPPASLKLKKCVSPECVLG